MDRVKLTINGLAVETDSEATILQAAEQAGIDIPRLCHHPELSQRGGCRLCVVEVQANRVLSAACVTPVSEGMVVETESAAVVKARQTILELLLANHPPNCITCDKQGECKLSEYCYRYGVTDTQFKGIQPHYPVEHSDPFIIRDRNKCILCGACVRACEELTGQDNLTFIGRSFHNKVGTAGDRPYIDSNCVFCGQCVAVCPVGALTEKSMAGRGRRWEFDRVRTTCPFCGTGCNFDLAVKNSEIVGVLSNPESPVNGSSLCVKGRFGWDYIYHEKRLTKPLIKRQGSFTATSWDEAFDLIAQRFNEVKDQHGPEAFAALSSARCTNEENYLIQKFTRGYMGSNNVDHCART